MPKLKLKQKTVVAVASIVAFILAALSIGSLFSDSVYFAFWKEFIFTNLGWGAYLTPLAFIFTGLVLQRLKWRFAQMNIFVGYLAMAIALIGLFGMVGMTQGGWVGTQIWELLRTINPIFAAIVLIFVFSAGLVVFLDTGLEQVFETLGKTGTAVTNVGKATTKVGSVFQRAPSADKELGGPVRLSGIDDRPMVKLPSKEKEAVVAETLVQNMAGQNRIWKYPLLALLNDKGGAPAERGNTKNNASVIEKTLDSFGIQARVAEINGGPAVTQYALEIATGTKIAKIANLQNDIALALATRTGTVRIEAPIPGKSLVGIEVPNHSLEIVTLKSVLGSEDMKKQKSKLAVALGKDTASSPIVVDLARMPHMLVAGTTGSGKSSLMNAFITSLLFRNSPDELKMILIDPKRVEFSNYNGIPHLLAPVIVEPEKILSSLKWATTEMDRRYKLFQSVGVRNIQGYNDMSGFQALPYIVIFIDELADLMMFAPVEVEDAITRLAQLARATGIHLVIATQRPSVDVITGLMKANIPARVAFNVSSMIDSRVIIDSPGAEKLLGRGDMLYMPPDAAKPMRVQGVFVNDAEINGLVTYLKEIGIAPEYTAEVTEMQVSIKGKGGVTFGGGEEDQDDLFEDAVRVVCQFDKASASLLQRKLRVGYARAARIMDELEAARIIGPGEGSKPRDVLVRNAEDYFANQGEGA